MRREAFRSLTRKPGVIEGSHTIVSCRILETKTQRLLSLSNRILFLKNSVTIGTVFSYLQLELKIAPWRTTITTTTTICWNNESASGTEKGSDVSD